MPLYEGADSLVQIMASFDLELEEAVARCELFAGTFRDYVRACVWDANVYRAPHRRMLEKVPFTADDPGRLARGVPEEVLATGIPSDRVTYRFGSGRHRLLVSSFRGEALVRVGTDTEAELNELLRLFPAVAET